MKLSLQLFCLLFISVPIFAQRNPDSTYLPNIHGIKFYAYGNQLSYPVIGPGSTASLELHFDDLDAKIRNYSYTYQLCDADWNVLDLSPLDYIQGFTQNRLNQYRVSSIAQVRYIHYQAMLPEKNCVPVKSGNYLLKVFLNGDTSKLAFTRRLLVLDNQVPIALKITQPYNSQLMRTHQKVQFSIDKGKLNILNPQQQLKVVVLQNYRWNSAVTGMQPQFMRNNIYEYNGERDFLFEAGKEYRWVDLQSFRYQSPRIESIDKTNLPMDVYVRADPQRSQERFLMMQDYNGGYYIQGSDVNNAWWQGDYAKVHFTFYPNSLPLFAGKDIYIMGEMTANALNDSTKLEFNEAKGVYEITLLLKQGFYNYTYVTKEAGKKNSKPETAITDGDYWETENSYTVLVYYRSLGNRYDELLGMATINSKFGTQ
ncbi:DUF5103 domain-containing protein [Panacibacter ginsenosidivorans]|uniref:DUF5103 domain-containing protein n=1 Tax=Panacibacter ginsenosidivorans TaxID=1813871 RepID=A0A5B8V765_9BACT|nr:DUF5103 domain-containing protein [Panacibacter ginsenosidivorans]QEC66526.1 DUF5103 domain-containing protein [Panacibacter ginsenosidivorans]